MSNEESPRTSRRTWIGRSLVVLAAVPALAACGGGGDLTCESGPLAADQEAMRRTLHYTDTAASPSRACSACALYVGNASACGTCQVIGGAIHPQGSCDSFVARS